MNRATFRLVLLVSCAHALVHVFELSLPSVELMIGDEFGAGRDRTGMLGTAWRLPFGLGALLAGLLADRFGSKRLLLVYLGGCSGMALLAYWAPTLAILFAVMFGMGCFASIYHPAGLALISTETTAANRPKALGWHGIVGSLGIAAAPFLAAIVFHTGTVTWRQYYALLVIPAVIIAGLLFFYLKQTPVRQKVDAARKPATGGEARWRAYLLLVVIGVSMGFTYAAFMHFLPRYLDGVGIRPSGVSPESFRNYLAALVLLFAAVGQGVAGKIARAGRLEPLMALILFANVPPLIWMSLADGRARIWAACSLALVHFMNQPVYNSLIAEYVPRARRSLGYGFSNTLCFGIGGFGPTYAGFVKDDFRTYGGLAILAAIAGLLALLLVRWRDKQA
ncbi:MAG: MFS transporter [Planctomycetes bacterium]|nr:MFS transporter [Planctomycetota bacterium]MBL7038488.1 MFS transporter [Pirellulaceae bacterium]